MAGRRWDVPDWKDFEQLVARIEKDAGPLGLVVTSPDRTACNVTGRKREVDASSRTRHLLEKQPLLASEDNRQRSVSTTP
jgi:hypothetical protein